MNNISILRAEIEKIDEKIFALIHKKGEIIKQIDELNQKLEVNHYSSTELQPPVENIKNIEFNQTIKKPNKFLFSREYQEKDTIIHINDKKIGNGKPQFVMGPCAVESFEQVNIVAKEMAKRGLSLLRGGAFKPRTSPYDFQGLGLEGLKILARVASENNMAVITEIMSTEQIDEALEYVDVIQIGARNMQNFALLKAVGKTDKPVLLKRGLSATIEEFKFAAEYILSEGNKHVILCERGIRTYETSTRNTLDISAVPILKQETHLPILVDVTHSTGRKDLLIPAAKAALAIGADGIMAEVHPNPQVALSDSKQQMNISEFHTFMDSMDKFSNEKVPELLTN
ncbi:bifunctional 3-deoxy-7-phosphoheptulonate synthase/chorismate mutase (plasmid) [Priestia aryabhattai]|uniref:bifunctional 3-deoxy-7-phosphoheptulonate synthase/chorismate mutase n=1 Tax=Priestia aryabhattai TaxID=412384 RepID=UPI00237947C7|nr:bifunctional 3-deoxy-7-phosphoheptulonate synthase/chorismate mutase [Priestia aryabhattai]WDL89827.1 bifunctional 3-deoxy-7-phosphoheptulonate synthase/chorismate mutase [Priestia aryabhattai]